SEYQSTYVPIAQSVTMLIATSPGVIEGVNSQNRSEMDIETPGITIHLRLLMPGPLRRGRSNGPTASAVQEDPLAEQGDVVVGLDLDAAQARGHGDAPGLAPALAADLGDVIAGDRLALVTAG